MPEETTYTDDSLVSTFTTGDITVIRHLKLIRNQYTGNEDVAEFSYIVENNGTENHSVGVRIMFDTMLGSNDSAPFRIPGIGNVTSETDLKGSEVPEFWQAFDSLSSPRVIAQGTLKIDNETAPDRVRFTNWGAASRNPWDYTRGKNYNGDSATCIYWNPKSVESGQTFTCKTYYGLSSLQQDNVPPLAVALSGATRLEVVENENGDRTYSPNPLTVTAYTQNIGSGTAYDADIELVLPSCMRIVDGDNVIDIPINS